ncbi:3-oxoacyl [Fusarium beomiforme]|uniref:3-oxoacyl n=1 Tax=Fusarium beomiforme TaxID=44412 RepID=A0A9P5AK95_9HYPO|nr:3-oxoacyl [Fusarium beomiforme]
MAFSLRGKHAIVVGGTGTLGFRIATALAERGSVVTIMSRNAADERPALEPRLKPFEPLPYEEAFDGGRRPREHQFRRLDVQRVDIFKGLFPNLGPVDVLVNCIGISQAAALKRTPEEEIQRILNLNLRATILASKYAKLTNHGCILNVSSLMATKMGAGATVYAASKAGVVEPADSVSSFAAFTRALALEYKSRSIRVNALLPGWIQSPMWNELNEAARETYLRQCPLGRLGTPDEVADAAMFLITNRFANNCVLNLDGGLSAN